MIGQVQFHQSHGEWSKAQPKALVVIHALTYRMCACHVPDSMGPNGGKI